MMTQAPECEISMKETSSVSMELPIQEMFDEFLVFISKTDFE